MLYARNIDEEAPFSIELAGETLPYNRYFIPRRPGAPWVFECVVSGKGYIEADGVKHPVTAGDFYMVSDYSYLEYYSDYNDPYQKVYVNCRGSLCRRLCQAFDIDRPFFIHHFPKAEKHIRSMHRILCNPYIPLATKDANCGYVVHRMLSELHADIQSETQEQRHELAYDIRSYLDQKIYEKVTLDELADIFFISKTRLISLFRNCFGVSPYQYLISQRITMACTLLKNSNLSVKEISEMLQFADSHYFSSFFKSRIGCSPSEYRRNI
ncbi:MAG: helix-turn-helix transcriptional regulator [Clostridia bacterium]|nr:helix-turn-helix transcriptional regulator [Clostridia bacterium]